MSYLQLTIVGNTGGQPEIVYSDQGVPRCTVSIAVNRVYYVNDEKRKETTWVRATAWRRTAEIMANHVNRGDEVMVIGRLTPDPATGGPRIWTGNDGSPRASYEMVADQLVLLSSRNGAQDNAPDDDGIAF